MDIILFFSLIVTSIALILVTAPCENGFIIFLAHLGSAALLAAAIYFYGPALNTAVFWVQNLAMLGSLLAGAIVVFTSMFRVSQFS